MSSTSAKAKALPEAIETPVINNATFGLFLNLRLKSTTNFYTLNLSSLLFNSGVTTSNAPISTLGSLTANHLVHNPLRALLVVAV